MIEVTLRCDECREVFGKRSGANGVSELRREARFSGWSRRRRTADRLQIDMCPRCETVGAEARRAPSPTAMEPRGLREALAGVDACNSSLAKAFGLKKRGDNE